MTTVLAYLAVGGLFVSLIVGCIQALMGDSHPEPVHFFPKQPPYYSDRN